MATINKHVLITGATKGIGAAIARQLKIDDYMVQGVARNFNQEHDYLESTVEIDIGDLNLLEASLPKMLSCNSTLILNAGYGQFGGLEQFSYGQIRRLVDTNLVGNLMMIKYYLPHLNKNGGDIVLMGSESGLQGARGGAVYCASKFALRGLAQSLRADCSNNNVRVHLVNPGPVNSSFFDELDFSPMDSREFFLDEEDVAAAVVHALEQPRHVVTEEINIQPIKRSFKKKKQN